MIVDFLRQYRALIIASLTFCLFCLVASATTHLNIYAFLVWNLFLAIIPLILSHTLATRKKLRGYARILLGVLWLIIFPNTFYLLTDLIHLSQFTFYWHRTPDFANVVYTDNITIWLGFAVMVYACVLATIIGYLTLTHIYKYLGQYKSRAYIFAAILLLTGYGTYLGRFARLNSWDIINPLNLIPHIIDSFTPFAALFSILFAGLITAIFFTIRSVVKK
jgi:uncharacterized membrane protein